MNIFALLVAYQIKHFLADYPLQGRYMLGKFKPGWAFAAPLLAHVTVHAAGTLAIALAFGAPLRLAVALGAFDAAVHFVMDRLKASPRWLGRWKPLTAATYQTADRAALRSNTLFWWCLGFDQMVHHLTHYACIWQIMVSR